MPEQVNATVNISGGSENQSNVTSGRALFWLPVYDTDQFTLEEVKSAIMGNGIMSGLQKFFEGAFGLNGFVTKNTTIMTNSTIPLGLDKIVAWISMNVDKEAQARCTDCKLASGSSEVVIVPATNNTNVTIPPPTNVTNTSTVSNVTNATGAAANQTVVATNATAANATTAAANQTVVLPANATNAANTTAAVANGTASNATTIVANTTGGV